MSIPHKGTNVMKSGNVEWEKNEGTVNLQNAEVTKMLDNKSEQKWPLAAQKRTDHKVRQSRVISRVGRAASACAAGLWSVHHWACSVSFPAMVNKDMRQAYAWHFLCPCWVLHFPFLHGRIQKMRNRQIVIWKSWQLKVDSWQLRSPFGTIEI